MPQSTPTASPPARHRTPARRRVGVLAAGTLAAAVLVPAFAAASSPTALTPTAVSPTSATSAALRSAGTAGAHGHAAPAGSAAQHVSLERLSFDVLPGLSHLRPTGAVPASSTVEVGIGIVLPRLAAAKAYYAEIYNPASPAYHDFLTPAQFAARFGVAPATYSRVKNWLRSGGLRLTQTTSAGDWVTAAGPASRVEALFHTHLARYRYRGQDFYANTSAPEVPAGDGIMSVTGLNTLQRFSTPKAPADARAVARAAARRFAGHPAGVSVPGCLPSCNYTPQDMWSLYNMPAQDLGQGQHIAIFGAGRTNDVIANLRIFEHDMHLPQIPVTVHDVGPGPFTNDSGQIEWDLDSQTTSGMAPDAAGITFYFANSLGDTQVEQAFTAWVKDPNGPLQANASFGECETAPGNQVWGNSTIDNYAGPGDNLEPVAEQTLLEATLEGRTLFSSAGDTGSSCPIVGLPVVGAGNGVLNQGFPAMNYPCSSNYAVCVGGTVLYSNGAAKPQRALEKSWTFTGGGAALFQAEPSFQKGVSAVDIPCAVNDAGNPFPAGTICRGVPDVAAMSGNIYDNGYDIVANGAPTTEGGTSLSSPLWVGMWTRVQAAAPAKRVRGRLTYPGNGFANETIYRVGKSAAYAKDFYDITIGDNGYYHAATGWDYTSGWGVPILTPFMLTVDHRLTPTHDVLPVYPKPVTSPVVRSSTGHGACLLPLWTNPPHTASTVTGISAPQLSLLAGNMATIDAGTVLQVSLTVSDLTNSAPLGATAEDWYMTWTYKGTSYFSNAQLSAVPGSTPTFGDGTLVKVGTSTEYSQAHTDTGKLITGKDGRVIVDVPLANVGNPAHGVTLGNPTGQTYTEEGIPPNPAESAGALEAVDSGGPNFNYTVGTTTGTCR